MGVLAVSCGLLGTLYWALSRREADERQRPDRVRPRG
jgi:hypothetical protein